jgi:hypothetical protein
MPVSEPRFAPFSTTTTANFQSTLQFLTVSFSFRLFSILGDYDASRTGNIEEEVRYARRINKFSALRSNLE